MANVKKIMNDMLKKIEIASNACSCVVKKAIKESMETEMIGRAILDVIGMECSVGCVATFS